MSDVFAITGSKLVLDLDRVLVFPVIDTDGEVRLGGADRLPRDAIADALEEVIAKFRAGIVRP